MSGRRKYFYSFDLESGNVNRIAELHGVFRQASCAAALPGVLPFVVLLSDNPTFSFLYTTGKQERSLQRLAISPDGSLIAFSGGSSGSVVLVSRKVRAVPGVGAGSPALCASPFALVGSRRRRFALAFSQTKHWLGELKMNTMARNFVFSPDGRRLISSGGACRAQEGHGLLLRHRLVCVSSPPRLCLSPNPLSPSPIDDSKMYIWDIGSRRCEHTFEDEGCIHSNSMAMAPNGSYFAAGYAPAPLFERLLSAKALFSLCSSLLSLALSASLQLGQRCGQPVRHGNLPDTDGAQAA